MAFSCVIVNDIHLADKPPRWRKESYAEDILAKLEWVVNYANHQTVDCVAFTGDVFHNPTPHRVSHWLVGRLLDLLRGLDAPLVCVPGNHDLSAAGMAALARQPLGVLVKGLPNATLLSSATDVKIINGYTIRGREWSYDTHAYLDLAAGPVADLLLLHGAVARKDNPHYETIPAKSLAGRARVVAYGHLHPPEKPYRIVDTTFVNVGALCRGALTQSDIERTPNIAVVTMEFAGGEPQVQYVPVAVAKSAGEIFRADVALFEKEYDEAAKRFVASLNATEIERTDCESLCRIAESMTDDKLVAEYCRQILMEVGA